MATMAHLRCDFYAETLELGTSMTVLLPQPAESQIGLASAGRSGPPPVLYLLHGLSDDDTMWLRSTSIERYAAAYGLAVVMPQVHRSFYTDMAHDGGRYWTFVSEELPAVVERFFNVSQRREDTFVAGLSMGGFGALKWALHQPDRFAAAASLSGVTDVAELRRLGDREPLMRNVFGGRTVAEAGGDLVGLLGTVADPASLPLYVCCGTEDEHLIDGNRRFAAAARGQGFDVTSDFGPGEHEWGYWDAQIQDVLAWLPLNPDPGVPG
ncbi:MAG TPA: alpha/beta hydrolase family protein [Dermatophilaceae bacterium]|nr:alpha/beta hydrolase family protein [Dermatophilaceae bacterium]